MTTVDEAPLFKHVYGGLIASAIGDAMGGPVEMLHHSEIEKHHGWIASLLPYHRPPGPAYVWKRNARAGTYTDDTRLKLIVASLLIRHGRRLTGRSLATEFIRRHRAATPGSLEQAWLQEWADVSRGFLSRTGPRRTVRLQSFYGGEVVCGGLITLPPLGFFFPGAPRTAYRRAFELAFFDLGYARDATAMLTALVSRAMTATGRMDRVIAGVYDDPYHLGTRPIFGRVCLRHVERALDVARQSKTGRELIEKFQNTLPRATPCDPAEILAVTLGILQWTGGEPAKAIPLAVNFGRDNDSIAGTVGIVAGTLKGVDAIPAAWVESVEQANPEPSIRDLARELCQSIRLSS